MFKEIFEDTLFENNKDMNALRNTKELRSEIQRLKKLMNRQSDELKLQTKRNIEFLERKLLSFF